MPEKPFEIAIIGAGFSGTMVAVNLARFATAPIKIHIIEKSPAFARGVAYSTDDLNHLLNVPAANMSAFPDAPDNFLKWLEANGHTADQKKFYPRKIYGQYLQSLFDNAATDRATISRINSAAIDFQLDNEKVTIPLADGNKVIADAAVLALGNLPPVMTDSQRALFQLDSRILHNPWSQREKLAKITKSSKILVIGTGLTMVDIVLSLFDKGHNGKITAVSRHGLLPQPHVKEKPPFKFTLLDTTSINQLFRFFREQVALAEKQGLPWQSVFDELRPLTIPTWRKLPIRERRRFMRHLRAWWDTRRHRMSDDVFTRLKVATTSGTLTIRAGRICHINPLEKYFEVAFKPRGSRTPLVVEKFDYIINCAAPEVDLEESKDPLIQNLLSHEIIRPGPMRMGLKSDGQGAIIGKDSFPSPYLYSLGPLMRGELWETTAVPELRVQASALAKTILENLQLREGARQGADI